MSEPNPGSDAAIDAGCTCPVLDNSHGQGWLCSGTHWIVSRCPLHGQTDGQQPIFDDHEFDVVKHLRDTTPIVRRSASKQGEGSDEG